MRAIYRGREAVIAFYAGYEAWFCAAKKFLLSFVIFYGIQRLEGNSVQTIHPLLLVMASAFCSFMPGWMMVLLGAVFLEWQLWTLSLGAALTGAVVIFVWLLLYFVFIPGQALSVLFTVIALAMGMPFMAPVGAALLTGPVGAASLAFGTTAWYLAQNLVKQGGAIKAEGAAMLEETMELLQSLLGEKEMLLMLVLLLSVFFVVCLIRYLPVSHSWTVAVISGAAAYTILNIMVMIFSGSIVFKLSLILDLALGLLVGLGLQFFCFSLDYRRVQRLQFEDDEYYYYVKAIPKWKGGGNEDE